MALSDHIDGSGVCGAAGMSRPISPTRSRTNRAYQDAEVPAQRLPPMPAMDPVARNARRPRSRGKFTTLLSLDALGCHGGTEARRFETHTLVACQLDS